MTAQKLVKLVFATSGFKKVTEFRDLVLKHALFAPGADQNNYATQCTEDGERTWTFSYPNRCFIHGWAAAGGKDLWFTHHRGNGGFNAIIFWAEDPALLIEELIKKHRPDLVEHMKNLMIQEVQNS